MSKRLPKTKTTREEQLLLLEEKIQGWSAGTGINVCCVVFFKDPAGLPDLRYCGTESAINVVRGRLEPQTKSQGKGLRRLREHYKRDKRKL